MVTILKTLYSLSILSVSNTYFDIFCFVFNIITIYRHIFIIILLFYVFMVTNIVEMKSTNSFAAYYALITQNFIYLKKVLILYTKK